MRKLIRSGLLLTCIFTVCEAAPVDSLQGTWSSKCAADGSGNFNIETFVFKPKNATYSIKTYKDASCTQKISTLDTYRNFKLGNAVPGLANTRELDYDFKSVTMMYNDSAMVNQANQSKYYGLSDWGMNQPKEVAGLKQNNSAFPEHSRGEKFFTIVEIENDKLLMGDYASGKGVSADTRLSKIYDVPFYKEK